MRKAVDSHFFWAAVILVLAGLFIFTSASLGIVVRENLSLGQIALKQFVVGILGGGTALYICSRIPYKFWRKHAFYLLLISIIATIFVFVPGIGFSHGGASRWISLGPITFQPSEFLKLAAVIYFAAWVSGMKQKVETFKFGLLPLGILAGICGLILLKQPDTDTFIVLTVALIAIFFVGGGKIRHILLIGLIGSILLAGLIYTRPYLMSRITTFINPASDSLGSSYQIQQSLIAIGNGGIFGRGFGQSIQKFSYLPEPMGDSIFAVAAEEFGFVGSVFLIFLFVYFTIRGLKIAVNVHDPFGRLLATGIVVLIVSQALMNIGAMIGALPLTGIPLTFVSHGGTALFVALAGVGIVLNISKSQKVSKEK